MLIKINSNRDNPEHDEFMASKHGELSRNNALKSIFDSGITKNF